jgi:hypothetical protein
MNDIIMMAIGFEKLQQIQKQCITFLQTELRLSIYADTCYKFYLEM